MSTALALPLEETIKTRSSVRTYSSHSIEQGTKEQLQQFISTLSNPFSAEVHFKLLQTEQAANARKLGTYGVIKGAKDYIGASVTNGALALEALGYEFEHLVLYATSLGLGTCWMGGTFKRSEFAKAMEVREDQLFPVISPIGYAADKRRVTENIVRKVAKSDQRKPWATLFFKESFSNPLTPAEAGDYAYPLEMTRLAPSASNKQPWRIIRDADGQTYHFYEYKARGYSDALGYDIQKVDLGIAACHFQLAAEDKSLPGTFRVLPLPLTNPLEHMHYLFSWTSS